MKRLLIAIKLFWFAFQHPLIFGENNFKALSDLFILMFKVAKENRAYMTHLAYGYLPEDRIVSIWITPKFNQSPLERIKELVEENDELRIVTGKQP